MNKSIKLHLLSLGSITCDMNSLIALYVRATSEDPEPKLQFKPFPVVAYYIETPEAKIVFDTGLRADCLTGGEGPRVALNTPISFAEGQNLEYQLSLCGVKPEEIDYVIMSHLHHDHAGKIGIFKNAKVLVQRAEMQQALMFTHTVDPMGVYLRADVDVDANWVLLDGDYEVVNGVKCLALPGHSDGFQGLQVELENTGTVIIAGDACNTSINYGPPARPTGILADPQNYYASIERIRKLQNATNATVFFGHDQAQFDTLKKAPEFYN